MNILFDNLESLIDAPNGIEKARELILQLAVQGKLVKQNPNDESASGNNKEIEERKKLIVEDTLKNKYPYKLPSNWKWKNHLETS